MSSFDTMTVARLRYPRVENRGAAHTDFTATPTETTIEGCWIEPTSSGEAGAARQATSTGYRLKLPEGTEIIDATDHIRIHGLEYECIGDAIHVSSPTGYLNHTQLTVERWEG